MWEGQVSHSCLTNHIKPIGISENLYKLVKLAAWKMAKVIVLRQFVPLRLNIDTVTLTIHGDSILSRDGSTLHNHNSSSIQEICYLLLECLKSGSFKILTELLDSVIHDLCFACLWINLNMASYCWQNGAIPVNTWLRIRQTSHYNHAIIPYIGVP